MFAPIILTNSLGPNTLKSLLISQAFVSNIRRCSGIIARHKSEDIPTHTGQVWDANDPRMVRFEVAAKRVNPNWAINLIKEVPPIPMKGRVAVCDGGPSEALGHPKIYINLDDPEPKSCIYCGLRYFNEDAHR